jgi:shikimate kinase/3-dehydroquinate synthase
MRSFIILTGFSGTGKSAIGDLLAETIGWRFIDTDKEVAKRAGKSIAELFSQDGEAKFRELESEVVRRSLRGQKPTVLTVGAGVAMDQELRTHMLSSGFVVCLEATLETIYRRLTLGKGNGQKEEMRPLLGEDNLRGKIKELKQGRQWAYALSHWTVHTDALSPGEVVDEVMRGWMLLGRRSGRGRQANGNSLESNSNLAAVVRTSRESYPVYVGWDILETQIGARIRSIATGGTAYIISDDVVFPIQGRQVQRSLEAAGVVCHVFVFPAGEQSKTLNTVHKAYNWLSERRAERGHVVVAVGGGVVGDLAGYLAATYLRGMPFVQVPTSLTAMVDASIGGKVGVNLEEGKNLVGAFYQPRLVFADVRALTTMPPRALREGWAEAIKHGLILDRDLFRLFEQRSDDLIALDQELTTEVVKRSIAIKARVVSEDERETMGHRILLNYGHTIGHALEAASGYSCYLHGEAVSIGMAGAAYLGYLLGITPYRVLERQQRVLEAFGLPTTLNPGKMQHVLDSMTRDKKVSRGAVTWVLLKNVGRAVTYSNVPEETVREAFASIRSY